MLFQLNVFVLAIVTCALVVLAAEPELTKMKTPNDWAAVAVNDDNKKCNDAKTKINKALLLYAEIFCPYCQCLKTAGWPKDAGKETICRLHAILMGKANAIGTSINTIPDSDKKKNVAQNTDVEIYLPILSKELLFSSALLRWNKDTKELVFECNGDVELGVVPQVYVMSSDKSKRNPLQIKPKTVTQFKYTATIKKSTVDSSSIKCTLQIDDVDIELTNEPDTTKPDTLMAALGGKDKVKEDLTKSACDRFTAAVNFAFTKDGGKLKLGDLPTYNQP